MIDSRGPGQDFRGFVQPFVEAFIEAIVVARTLSLQERCRCKHVVQQRIYPRQHRPELGGLDSQSAMASAPGTASRFEMTEIGNFKKLCAD